MEIQDSYTVFQTMRYMLSCFENTFCQSHVVEIIISYTDNVLKFLTFYSILFA